MDKLVHDKGDVKLWNAWLKPKLMLSITEIFLSSVHNIGDISKINNSSHKFLSFSTLLTRSGLSSVIIV